MQVKGVEWRIQDGSIAKTLIRVHPITKRAFREPVSWVETDNPFCGICLSDKVHYDHEGAFWACTSCGLSSDAPSVTL